MRLGQQSFILYVAINMVLCAFAFFPWARPRETLSGIMGRWQAEGKWCGRIGATVINALYWWEPDHCRQVYLIEQDAREILYP